VTGPPPSLSLADVANEGVWRTDLVADRRWLLVSLERLAAAATQPERVVGEVPCCFHTKLNRQGTRVLQVLRFHVPGRPGRHSCLLSFAPDGSGLREIVDRESWSKKGRLGGHANHPNWHPDGERVVLNMVPHALGQSDLRFCAVRADGSDLQVLSARHLGSGHPSVDPSGNYLLSDAYPRESWVVDDDGEIPIRILDLGSDEEVRICSIPVAMEQPRKASRRRPRRTLWQRLRGARAERPVVGGSHFKLDPHPAWSRDSRSVCFNGAPDGRRQVFVADLSNLL
jgi:Tol biopolymer transport system component